MSDGKAYVRNYEACLLADCGKTFVKFIDIAPTLLVRDCKGMTTYGSAGVLEERKLEEKQVRQIGQIYADNNPQAGRVYDSDGISPTVDTMTGGNRQPKVEENLRIRRLTPRECWRLQGQRDAEFDKAAQVNSDSQLYKQAGNSITVDTLVHLMREVFKQLEKG